MKVWSFVDLDIIFMLIVFLNSTSDAIRLQFYQLYQDMFLVFFAPFFFTGKLTFD